MSLIAKPPGALLLSLKLDLKYVSFPCSGAGNLHADQVAVAMMDAIQNFLQDNPQPNVTSIHIVIFQQNMFSSFEQAMKKYKVSPGKAW